MYTLKVIPKTINDLTVEIELYKNKVWVASVEMKFKFGDNTTAWIEGGRTAAGYQRQGFGTWLRALCVHLAKKAGVSHIFQFSKNINRVGSDRPPSAYIMNKLGFDKLNFKDPMHPKTEMRLLHTKNSNMTPFFRNIRFTL